MDIGFVFAVIWAFVFALSIDVEALTLIPQEKWFSFTGGVSAAYVILDILPRLAYAQLPSTGDADTSQPNIAIYCVMLSGLLVFYGLEQLALRSRHLRTQHLKTQQKGLEKSNLEKSDVEKSSFERSDVEKSDVETPDLSPTASTSPIVFAIHMAVFTTYVCFLNVLQVGYKFEFLLIERSLLFTVLVLHFIVMNHRLTEHHQWAYRRIGRWIIVAVLLLSAVVTEALLTSTLTFDYIWAFIAGALLVSSLQDELRFQKRCCFWSFGFGAVIFSIVLILL
ncbi:MAG: hypothetical protein VKL39_13235 [Leptolyngbyaceae bacterium]|nr:hypothetical protein [Leptolyngbyaceae bacterium]